MIHLSKRLQTVVSLVTPGNIAADIGCDHAHTGIFLVQAGVSPRVIAMDLRKGPLEKAAENVAAEGLADKIDLRLSNGLEKLNPGETDTVLISGMGGPLILEILEKGITTALSAKELVLSPQSDLEGFPENLAKLGFTITDKRIVKEEDKFYFVFRAVKTEEANKAEDTVENNVQPRETWLEFLRSEEQIKRRIIERLEADSGEKAAARRKELYNDIRRIEDEINRMRN